MALTPTEPWRYFHPTLQATALTALRARMGASYATSPSDAALLIVLARAVAFLHKYTGRFFLKKTGTIKVSGTGDARLHLPFPVVSTDQGGTGITAITLAGDTSALDTDSYSVNDGAQEGPNDPRDDPFVEWASTWTGSATSRPPLMSSPNRYWPYGVQNVEIDGTFGYLEEDGATPEPILHALARVCVLNADPIEDSCAMDDRRRGAIVSESVQGRSYTLATHATSAGLTLDREVDLILRGYRRPPVAVISRAPRVRSRARYFVE